VSYQKRLVKRRVRRAFHVRNRTRGTAERPRLSVHRTNKHVYAQVIDDETGRTLCAASSVALKVPYGGNVEAARTVGETIGQRAQALEIKKVRFDRGSCRYHGRIKALADAVRAAGVEL
jgi:large subunit ribosomal protein L18